MSLFYCGAESLGKAFDTGDSRCAVQCDFCAGSVPKEAETTPKVEVPMPDKVATSGFLSVGPAFRKDGPLQKPYDEWWGNVSRQGDPSRVPNLTTWAFLAGWIARGEELLVPVAIVDEASLDNDRDAAYQEWAKSRDITFATPRNIWMAACEWSATHIPSNNEAEVLSQKEETRSGKSGQHEEGL